MLGLMQDWPLLVHKILDHAALYHGAREVVSRSVEGPVVRTSYGAMAGRARKVAHALERHGIAPGDRVVVDGAEKLTDGMKVTVRQAAANSAATRSQTE